MIINMQIGSDNARIDTAKKYAFSISYLSIFTWH